MIALLLGLAEPPVLSVPPTVFADARVTAPSPLLVWPDGTIVRVEAASTSGLTCTIWVPRR